MSSLGHSHLFQALRGSVLAEAIGPAFYVVSGMWRVSHFPFSHSELHTLSQWPLEACGRCGHLPGFSSASLLWQKPLRSGVWPPPVLRALLPCELLSDFRHTEFVSASVQLFKNVVSADGLV